MTDKMRKLYEQSGLLFPTDAAPRSPIEMILETISENMKKETDELILRAVQETKVKVNREELIRALQLDKMVREGKLVEPVRCRDCKHAREVDEWEWWCSGFGFPARLVTAGGYCYKGERKEDSDGN